MNGMLFATADYRPSGKKPLEIIARTISFRRTKHTEKSAICGKALLFFLFTFYDKRNSVRSIKDTFDSHSQKDEQMDKEK